MIEVKIEKDGVLIGHMQIDRTDLAPKDDVVGDYRIMYRVWRGAQAAHRRIIYGFPRTYANVFALVLQALTALNEKDLLLEPDTDLSEAPVSADMGGGLDPTMRTLPPRKR